MLTEQDIQRVWNEATIVDGYNKDIVRKDCCGAWIVKSEYGKATPFGWEVDHAFPVSKGGKTEPINLRAMHWENNRSKADDFPVYNVAVQAKGNVNQNVTDVMYKINDNLRIQLEERYK
ncbi:MAG: HNH endonuclease [Bacteroidales bacterium]|nr:HNH endonuclease [Bacteroidales bacterium]